MSDKGMTLDLGPRVNRVDDNTIYLSSESARVFQAQLDAVAGRDFFGRTSVEVIWEAGHIKRFVPRAEESRL